MYNVLCKSHNDSQLGYNSYISKHLSHTFPNYLLDTPPSQTRDIHLDSLILLVVIHFQTKTTHINFFPPFFYYL